MKKIIRMISIILFIVVSVLAAQAQKTIKPKTSGTNTSDSTNVPKNQIEKTQADADKYIKIAEDTKNKIKIWFPSKPGDTVYAVIPNISYADPNLKFFKGQLDAIKSTRGLTSSYRAGNAVIKVVYKGGNASKLYDILSDQVKELFIADEIEGNRIILNYRPAKPFESSGEKSL
jgi:hypothetical protein